MNQEIYDQITGLIDKSQSILLMTHARSDADGLGAMLSMYKVLKGMGKDVSAVTNDPAPEELGFLPSLDIVQNSIGGGDDFVISVSTANAEASKIKYNVLGDKVNIVISPKEGGFKPEDVSFLQGSAQFDLIMTFDTGNLEHLGPIYDENAELFFKTPLINVDHHASNTDYGQINLVDVVAASATEVLFGLLKDMEKKQNKKLVDEDIATLLLAGIITDTGSFQHSNTSPQAMATSAELLDLGARQQEIIKNIYKTKKLSTLKLWGIVLSKVQVDPVYRMVWSTLSEQDLREAGAKADETGTIIDDLLATAPGAEVIFLIKQGDNGVTSVSMRSTSNAVDVGKLSTEMGGGGHIRAAGFRVSGQSFEEAVNTVVSKARAFQAERLNIQPGNVPAPAQEVPQVEESKEEVPQEPQGERVETPLEFAAPEVKAAPKKEVKPEKKAAPKKQEKKEEKPKAEKKPAERKSRKQTTKKEQSKQEKPTEAPKPEVKVEPAAPKPVEPAPAPTPEVKAEPAPEVAPEPVVEAQPAPPVQEAPAPAPVAPEPTPAPPTPEVAPQAPAGTVINPKTGDEDTSAPDPAAEKRPPDVPDWLKPE